MGNGITRGFGALFNSEALEKDIENENSSEELNQESLKSKPLIEKNNFSSSLIEIDINRVSKPKISKKEKPEGKNPFQENRANQKKIIFLNQKRSQKNL